VKLTEQDLRMLNGEEGPGRRKCMDFLVKMGEAFDAEEMGNALSAQIHAAIPLDYLKELTEGVKGTKVFTTTHANWNPSSIDPEGCKRIGLPKHYDIYELIRGGDPPEKVYDVYRRMGYYITHTCTPFYAGNIPRPGNHFSWCGSAGQVLMNSWFGACGNRDSVPFNVAVTVTNRTPLMGLALKKNRYAQVLARTEGLNFQNFSDADWGALGYHLGAIAGPRNVAIEGLPSWLSTDQFRLIASALPVSGAVCLCHVIGITPEAPTLQTALGKKKPEIEVVVRPKDIKEAYAKLTTATGRNVDSVTLGCPHCSIQELKQIAELLNGKQVNRNVRLLVAAYRGVLELARTMGYIDVIKNAGGVLTDCCVGSQHPFSTLGPNLGVKVNANNSARMDHYMIRISNDKVKQRYGSMKDCIKAAITGKWEGK
jgi:cis-L-3-hydroxyproline dehydratase